MKLNRKLHAPLVSIVTPSFNSVNTISDTLNSIVLLSDYLIEMGYYLELLVIDGGSNDGTYQLICKYLNLINNLSWISEVKGGPYRAMNEGLKIANGFYSYILNSDDYLSDPIAFADFLVAGYHANSIVMLSSIAYFRRPSKTVRHTWSIDIPEDNILWKKMLMSGLHYPHPGFIARSDIYASECFDERYSLSADYKLMQKILLGLSFNSNVYITNDVFVAMAEGGATSGFRAVIRGQLQINKINKELGIKVRIGQRYKLKIWRRLVGLWNLWLKLY